MAEDFQNPPRDDVIDAVPEVVGGKDMFTGTGFAEGLPAQGDPVMAKKKAATKSSSGKRTMKKSSRKKAGKRQLINTGRDKRFLRRTASGQFNESDDVGKSLSQDRRRKAKKAAKKGQGDKGDQKRK